MVIRNCLSLLSELSRLESNISTIEEHLNHLDIEIDKEKILRHLIEDSLSTKS